MANLLINPFLFDPCPPFVGVTEPDDFAGLIRWYAAETYNQGNATPISAPWTDLSASLSDATPDVGFEPEFRTTFFGSCRPGVFLGGTGLHNFAFNSGAITFTDFTILIVGQAVSDSLVLSNSAVNRQIRLFRSGLNQVSVFTGSVEVVSPTLTYPGTGTPRMTGWKRAADVVSFYENDLAVAGAGGAASMLALNQIGLKDGGPLNFHLAEIAIYNVALSDGDVLTLYTDYFKPKYGLTP